jgi:hypothetical protein
MYNSSGTSNQLPPLADVNQSILSLDLPAFLTTVSNSFQWDEGAKNVKFDGYIDK